METWTNSTGVGSSAIDFARLHAHIEREHDTRENVINKLRSAWRVIIINFSERRFRGWGTSTSSKHTTQKIKIRFLPYSPSFKLVL